LVLGALACQPPGSVTKADLDELKTEIMAKLDAIEKKQVAKPAAKAGPPAEDFNKIHKISTKGSAVLGNPDAPVSIVEYSDFQCPFCSRVQPVLKEVLNKYPDKVNLVFKHFPLSFHRAARPAAVASQAALEQGKFWEMHDVLFENQKTLDASKMDEYAKEAGLDVPRFNKDMEANKAKYEKQVEADFREGQAIDVRGTPSLYIGGKKVRARSVEAMGAMIDEAIKRDQG
jgi:protein-disulfide isomerase